MKLLNKRFAVQLACILLTAFGVFTNIQLTMAIILGATFIAGTFYCGWVCPFGTIQDLFSRLGKWFGLKKVKMPKVVQKYLKYSRYLVMILVMVSAGDMIFNLMSYDPRVTFNGLLGGETMTIASGLVILSFALIGMVFERPFCNYLCFEGAKYGLMSSTRVFTIKRNDNTCVGCNKCDKVCPMNIEVSSCKELRSTQCINCFECTQACPVDNTLTYGTITWNKKLVKRVLPFALVILVGIAGFFLYNGLNSSEQTVMGSTSEVIEVPELTPEELALLGDAEGIEDGVYEGVGQGFRGQMTVEVTVEKQRITDVTVTNHRDDAKWFNRANRAVPDDIVDSQSTDVDSVSGATYSSDGIIEAAKDALEKAGK